MHYLKEELLHKIKKHDFISLDDYIKICLYHKSFGYYMSSNPLGAKNDFITAPEVSSLFGEMIAYWLFDAWRAAFNQTKINIVELGSGSGKLIVDILQTLLKNKSFEEFLSHLTVNLIEVSPKLINLQKKNISTLPDNIKKKVNWLSNFNQINNNPTFFLANEFFDAQPIKAFYNSLGTISEIVIKLQENKLVMAKKKLNFEASKQHLANFPNHQNNSIIEISQESQGHMKTIAKLINKNNGIALIIDYGYLKNPGIKLSLQAVKKHKKISNHLDYIGECDLTSYVDFNSLITICYQIIKGNMAVNIITQREFLINCGIAIRLENSIKNSKAKNDDLLRKEVDYLISKDRFGEFKVLMIAKANKNS